MPIGVQNFQPLDFDQNNPFITGMGKGQQLFSNIIKNSFAPQNEMASLKDKLLENIIKSAQAKYAEPNAMQTSRQLGLQTQMMEPEAKYATPLTLAKLSGMQNRSALEGEQARYYGRNVESEISSRNKQAALNDFYLKNPAFLGSGLSSELAGLQSLGGGQVGQGGMDLRSIANNALMNKYPSQEQTAELKRKEYEAKSNVTQYDKLTNKAEEEAKTALDIKQYSQLFKDAYKDTAYKGSLLGMVPSKGIGSPGIFGADVGRAQDADMAANNLQSMAAKALGSAKLTNQELAFAGGLKLNRSMTPKSIKNISDLLEVKAERVREKSQFLQEARDKGLPHYKASTLWDNYEDAHPLVTSDNKLDKKALGKWHSYLGGQDVDHYYDTSTGVWSNK